MVVVLEKLFIVHFQHCPIEFQKKFRKVYQQLKAVDKATDIKGVFYVNKKFCILKIDKSRIALKVEAGKVTVGLFLYNEFYKSN